MSPCATKDGGDVCFSRRLFFMKNFLFNFFSYDFL